MSNPDEQYDHFMRRMAREGFEEAIAARKKRFDEGVRLAMTLWSGGMIRREIADRLNADGYRTVSGHAYTESAVRSTLAKFGGPAVRQARQATVEARRANAVVRASEYIKAIEAIRAAGVTSASGIARELNRQGVKAVRGGAWQAVQVQHLLRRLG
jgi:hypothetical protein